MVEWVTGQMDDLVGDTWQDGCAFRCNVRPVRRTAIGSTWP